MPSLKLSNWSIPWDGSTIQLQPRTLSALLLAHLSLNGLLPTICWRSPSISGVFGLLWPFQRNHLTLFHFLHFPFLLQIKIREQSDYSYRERRRRRGEIGRYLGLRYLLNDPHFLLPARRQFSPFLEFISISSSSLELGSTQATMSLGEWAAECLSNSSSESGSWIIGSARSFLSFSKWNWSISTSSDRRKEAVSFLGTTTSGKTCWKGSSTGGRSSQARKLGSDTSILASQGSPTLIVLPTSWNASKRGTKSKIGWMAHNCLSSLTKISDLRPQHLVETWNVDEAKFGSNVPFICKDI